MNTEPIRLPREHDLLLTNSPRLTGEGFGIYGSGPLSNENAIETIRNAAETEQLVSAIGHEATANALSALTGVSVPMNRIQVSQEPGQEMIAVQLDRRLPEGVILNEEALRNIGFSFMRIVRMV